MSKPAALIMKPRYLYIKQIKINYDIQFSTDPILNNKIKKKQLVTLEDHVIMFVNFHSSLC
jgi:hypothetical protein